MLWSCRGSGNWVPALCCPGWNEHNLEGAHTGSLSGRPRSLGHWCAARLTLLLTHWSRAGAGLLAAYCPTYSLERGRSGLAPWLPARCLTSLGFCFLINKMGTMIPVLRSYWSLEMAYFTGRFSREIQNPRICGHWGTLDFLPAPT